ncbi:Putative hemagglutinin-related protein [Richelia intracellularis]|nr:Putative hemagglutinin-related protein [Richelia intracellularis]
MNNQTNIKLKRRYFYYIGIVSGITLYSLSTISPLKAQISADTTLLNGQTVVLPGTTSGLDFLIRGGTQAGNNLFHSFNEFSVPTHGSVIFQNNTNLTNIINRVTGTSLSNIDGLIQTNGNANFFLINPNGIIFRSNASLNINGSFIGTTASSIKLDNGHEFSAINPTPPLLSVSVPLGLQFGNKSASIINQSQFNKQSQYSRNGKDLNVVRAPAGLQVKPSKTLALIGNDIQINRGNITVPGGRLELGSVKSNSFVGLSSDLQGLGFNFDYKKISGFRDIQLLSSILDVSGPGGGKAKLQGKTVNINQSSIYAITFPNGLKNGGEITLRGNELNINQSNARAITFGTVQGGDINLEAKNIAIQSRSVVSAETRNVGKGGNLNIRADNDIKIAASLVGTETKTSNGNAGDVLIDSNNLTVKDGAQILVNTLGKGDAGELKVKATNSIELVRAVANQSSGLFSVNRGSGKSKGITIETYNLSIRDGASISNSVFANGDSGQIVIQAQAAELIGTSQSGKPSGVFNEVKPTATAKGGNISFTTGTLQIYDGAQISTTTFGPGDAGRISIIAPKLVEISAKKIGAKSSGLFAQVEREQGAPAATGKGGDIDLYTGKLTVQGNKARISATTGDLGIGGNVTINAKNVLVRDGAQIQAATLGLAPGGKVKVTAKNNVELIGVDNASSGLFTSTKGDASAGDLTVNTQNLSIQDGARISASSSGKGLGGTISINALDGVRLVGTGKNSEGEVRSGLYVQATGTGKAGQINLNARSLLLDKQGEIVAESTADDGGDISLVVTDTLQMKSNSLITATAGTVSQEGDGGNIDIQTTFLVAPPLENSDIIANAFEGTGGNINITANSLFGISFNPEQTIFSDITASSNSGVNGVVEIKTPEVDPTQGLVELPMEVTDTSKLVTKGCTNLGKESSRFVVTGKGGLAPSPEALVSSNTVLQDLQTTPITNQQNKAQANMAPAQIARPTNTLVEAQAMVMNARGEVVLIAEAPQVTPRSSWLKATNCHGS